MKMIKYVMRNLGNNALRNNKQFDTLDEAVLFAKGSNCWIDEVEVRSDGYFKSTEKVRKVIITNTPEEIFTPSTIVLTDKPSITINKIVVVEEYGSAYTIHEGAFLFTPIGEYNQIYYTTNPYEGGNVYDDWSEVDRSIADEHYDYDAILKALDYKEGE